MDGALGTAESRADAAPRAGLRFLKVMLALQVALGLLWGVSMLFFARQIVLGAGSDPHVEKIAMEGAAHFMLVLHRLRRRR